MFENIEDAKAQIRTRTSKIIGGYVTENLFLQEYRNLFSAAYSKGWWGGIERSKDKLLTFFIVKDELNDLDLKVIERLQGHGYCWKQLTCENNQWFVKDSASSMTIEEYVRVRELVPNIIHHQVKDDPYLDNCIQEYERDGMLQEIASSIYIEDNFLNVYFTISNIDLICENSEGIPVYVEIKFKNEFQKEYSDGIKRLVFGIDEFQYDNLFTAFINCGMQVINVVLYNDVKDKQNTSETVIFEFLSKKNNQGMIWKYKSISLSEGYEKHSSDNGQTGWGGKGRRTVYCIPLKKYSDVSTYSLSKSLQKRYPEGAWGICSKCNEAKVISFNRSNGKEFMGCLGYSNHPKSK